jgi:hypothetical protein
MTTNQDKKAIKSIIPDLLKISRMNILSLLQLADKNFKAYLALIGVLATAIGGLATLPIPLIEANIQAEATKEAARIGAASAESIKTEAESLPQNNINTISPKNYIDGMSTLLILQRDSASNSTAEKDIGGLLKSNSFAALRNLSGQDKGVFIRFLAENGLITAEQPEVLLAGANLREIDLEDAWLPDINLQRAYILDANLANTNLTRVNLSNAVLKGTDLTGAVLTDTDFTDADLTGAQLDVEKAIQVGAIFCNATMPDGTKGDCG